MGECQIQVSKPTILVSGYYVDTVGKNIKKIEEYIRNQLKEDKIATDFGIRRPVYGKTEIMQVTDHAAL